MLLAVYLGLSTTVFRGIPYTRNDNLNQDFNRQATRYRVRPIPRGAVSTARVYFFISALMVVRALIL